MIPHAAARRIIPLLIFAIAAYAQAQPDVDRDIQALFANDDAVVALRQDLAAQKITKAAFTAESQKLAQARKEIAAHYDRAGQRDLVARYRVAVRQRQLKDAEAKRQARELAQQQQQPPQPPAPAEPAPTPASGAAPSVQARFPEPSAIVAGFSVKGQQYAALRIFDALLRLKAEQPNSTQTRAKIARYRAMMSQLQAENGIRPEFQADIQHYLDSTQFRVDVLHRYLPEYENVEIPSLSRAARAASAAAGATQAPPRSNSNLTVVATLLLILAVPVVYFVRGERVGSPSAQPLPPNFQLPESLATIKLLFLRLFLQFDCGRIYDHKITQHKVETTHVRQRYSLDGTPQTNYPADLVTTTTYYALHHYLAKTPDGRNIARTFDENSFPSNVGDIISTLHCDDRMLYACNHSQGTFLTLHGGIGQTLRMRAGRGMWLLMAAIGVAGAAVAMSQVAGDDEYAWRAFWAMSIFMGLFGLACIFVLRIVIQLLRRAPFHAIWQPRLRKFMESQTQPLQQQANWN